MKINFTYSVVGFFVILIVAGLVVKTVEKNKPGIYDEFAQCLTNNGAAMYGEDWCGNCQAQKRMFGSSFKYMDYVECGLEPDKCRQESIEGYPTWKKHSSIETVLVGKGVQTLETLAGAFSCELPQKGRE